MTHIDLLSEEEFQEMPLVVEGESKEVRYAGRGLVVIRYKPTIYSFTANRAAVVEGSDVLRLRATSVFLDVLRKAGIDHSYRAVNDRWVVSRLLLHPAALGAPPPFIPDDVGPDFFDTAPVAPPIEVVVKRYHSGTSKHRYRGMSGHPVRSDHRLFRGTRIADEDSYPAPIVRFDWRNPLRDAAGKALADEVLGDDQADLFIDVKAARKTALRVYEALEAFLAARDIVCYDLCLFLSQDGKTVFGEISQDCGRFRHFDLGSLDKDVWRAGGSSADVLKKWRLLNDLISKEAP